MLISNKMILIMDLAVYLTTMSPCQWFTFQYWFGPMMIVLRDQLNQQVSEKTNQQNLKTNIRNYNFYDMRIKIEPTILSFALIFISLM